MNDQFLTYADTVIHLITALELDNLIATAMPSAWAQGSRCLQSSEASDQLLGYRLILMALATTPDAPRLLIAALERKLAGQC